MKIISISLLFVASGLSFQSSTWAQMSSGFPTLCQTSEFAFLNARLEKFEKQGKGYNLKQTGKIISLCADKPKEPFSKFFYRFGTIGNVEMEQVATSNAKFGIYNRSTTPKTGENIFSFANGNFNYYVAEATGMGSGISVMAYKSDKRIASYFSGNDNEYQSNLEEVDFDKARSPVFMKKALKNNLDDTLRFE